MNVAALPDERGIRTQGAYTARGRAVHSGSVYVRQTRPITSLTPHRPTATTADQRQADYYLRMFTESYRLVEERIEKYQREIAFYEAAGDPEGARSCRRELRADERERQAVRRIIVNLRRRFVDAPDEVPLNSRRARLGVR